MTNTRYQLAVYCRVSTEEQSTDSQRTAIDAWLANGQYRKRDVIWYEDKATGATLTRRGIERLSRDIASGRVTHVVFYSIDRFARELIAGLNQIDEWARAGVRLTFIADGLDISPPFTDAMLKMILAIRLCMAEAERARIRDRVRLGQLAAMQRGVRFGRPVEIKADRIRSLRAKGIDVPTIAKRLRCSVPSVYRVLATTKGEAAAGEATKGTRLKKAE